MQQRKVGSVIGVNTLRLKELVYDLQELYLMSARGTLGIFRKPFYFNDTIEQMDYAGAGSFFIIVLVSLFVGMALSLQLSAELSIMGLKTFTGKIVGISIIRELGPMVVALVYIGRVGAGTASELGSMVLGHQVDTLRAFGVDPIKKLVTPRIISSLIIDMPTIFPVKVFSPMIESSAESCRERAMPTKSDTRTIMKNDPAPA